MLCRDCQAVPDGTAHCPTIGVRIGEMSHHHIQKARSSTQDALTRYRPLSAHLRARFGGRVQRVVLAGGFTCPNRDGTKGRGGCTFCSAVSMTAPHVDAQDVSTQLAQGIERMSRRYGAEKFLAYFNDFSATYAPVDRLEALYSAALDHPGVVGLALGTRPDCLPDEVLSLLAELNEKTYLWVELGLQSASNETLQAINRGHDVAQFTEATHKLAEHNIAVCAHVILGLPGEGPAEFSKTAELIASLPLAGIKFHNLHVLRHSALERQYRQGLVTVPDRNQYIEALLDFLEHIPGHLVVHRLAADAPADHLLAPDWMKDKNTVLTQIRSRLVTEDRWQGKALGEDRTAPSAALKRVSMGSDPQKC